MIEETSTKGSCQCGSIVFEVDGLPILNYACYCAECRRASSALQTSSLAFPRNSFRILTGVPKSWERLSDAGVRNVHYFCPDCGNRIYGENPNNPDLLRINPYTLDDQTLAEPEVCFWTASKPDWATLPENCLAYDKQVTASKLLKDVQANRNARIS